ncbi:spore coat protein U domain-containing protein [Rhodanobacter sp. MP7CTX1]|jgi:spore coat protein U-like protein|uniref:Csu type fimbrial protein n=1 Tax=Rhodanobacter sp. MP7CTX1 TaxID=2723084 RepID=UPI0016114816|nr:spore coat protein U domain-containing protein [Rhodanobacter sp. MP7CTX1]MBB6188271.1 spore coat protein U-like protein [Rhodanobacter sp. MP7CTX1]
MNFKKTLLATAFVAFGGFAINASAATAAGTFSVSLTITKTCVVNTTSASNITLGSTTSGGTSTSSSGAFTVNCSNKTPFTVGLSPSNVSSTTGAGTMKGTGTNNDTVTYQLYSNSALSTVWGNIAANLVSGTGGGMSSGKAVSETVYANATGSTDVAPDLYADNVAINVTY